MGTVSATTAGVTAGGGTVSGTITVTGNQWLLQSVTVYQASSVGGTHDFGLFQSSACTDSTQYAYWEDWSGTLVDPVDDSGNAGGGGLITEIVDTESASGIHYKCINNDSTDKAYEVTLELTLLS